MAILGTRTMAKQIEKMMLATTQYSLRLGDDWYAATTTKMIVGNDWGYQRTSTLDGSYLMPVSR